MLVKTSYTVAVMAVVVLGLCFAMPLRDGIVMYIQVAVYGATGALVFLAISIKNSLLVDVLGEGMIERLTGKIKPLLKRLRLMK